MYLRAAVVIVLLSVIFSCKKEEAPEDVFCENGQLDLCNSTTDQIVVYAWGSNQVSDTLFPGECKLEDFGPIKITYYKDGSIKEKNTSIAHFYTNNGSYMIELVDCYVKMDAPTGYINIAHCYNGVFDPQKGELDTDCGGNCLPCKNFNISCDTMPVNRLKWSDQSKLITLSSVYPYNQYNNKKSMEFRFYDGEVLYLLFPGNDFPTKNARLQLGEGYNYAEMWYTERYGMGRRDAVDGGSVYFIIDDDGKRKVQFCDLDFKYASGLTIQASGNFNVDR